MTAGVPTTRWDRQETRDLHKQALLGHDLLVNCVVTHTPTTPFVEQADLDHERRLRVLADVTCDVTGPTNMLPVNTADHDLAGAGPATARRRLRRAAVAPLEVIAIDNLPSLLPREASEGFSADLTPHLLGLAEDGRTVGAVALGGPRLRAGDRDAGRSNRLSRPASLTTSPSGSCHRHAQSSGRSGARISSVNFRCRSRASHSPMVSSRQFVSSVR